MTIRNRALLFRHTKSLVSPIFLSIGLNGHSAYTKGTDVLRFGNTPR